MVTIATILPDDVNIIFFQYKFWDSDAPMYY